MYDCVNVCPRSLCLVTATILPPPPPLAPISPPPPPRSQEPCDESLSFVLFFISCHFNFLGGHPCVCANESRPNVPYRSITTKEETTTAPGTVCLCFSPVFPCTSVCMCVAEGGNLFLNTGRGVRVCIRNRSLSVRLSLHWARPKHVPLVLVRRSSSPAKASRTPSPFHATVGPHGASRQVVLMF
ncbi:unnamed protein product [Arctogadus glacialis]